MAVSKSQTEFASSFSLSVTESAANTLTFEKIESGLMPLDKVGWVLQKLQFQVSALQYMNGTGDSITFGICVSNKLTDINPDNSGVIYSRVVQRLDFGAAASASIYDWNYECDLSNLQGGGVLVLPSPLYLAAYGGGLSAASTVLLRAYFFPIVMSDSDYFNLVQSRQILINS